MLTEELNMLLRGIPGFIDVLRVLGRASRKLFCFVLDFGMKTA
jgi:hypothetical protein